MTTRKSNPTKRLHPTTLTNRSGSFYELGPVKNQTNQQKHTHLMANVNIKPLGDRVLVKPLEEKEITKGGIIIPDAAKEKPQEAEVIAVGTGKRDDDGKLIAFTVKVGDKVLVSKYGGTEVKVEGESFTIMREDDILGIIG